jgi:hypothetical protein
MDLFSRLYKCRKYIEDALEYSGGTHTFDDIAAGVLSGDFQLWHKDNSAIVTEIVVYPRLKDLHFFLAGGNLDELQQMTPIIEDWGKSVGCTRVTLAGRKGWQRTFLKDRGYEPQWQILSKELKNE